MVQTYTGKALDLMAPEPDSFDIESIAVGLSRQPRFNGHTRERYTVAQHSVLVSLDCDPEDALWGLLHDASEAFLADLVRPIKVQPEMGYYMIAEGRLMDAICARFGLGREMPASVKRADNRVLGAEVRDLYGPLNPEVWGSWTSTLRDCWPGPIVPWTEDRARVEFLRRYADLGGRSR